MHKVRSPLDRRLPSPSSTRVSLRALFLRKDARCSLILCFLRVIEDHHEECYAVLWKADRRSAFQRIALHKVKEGYARLSEGYTSFGKPPEVTLSEGSRQR